VQELKSVLYRLAMDSSAAAAAMRLMKDPFTLESNTQQKRS